MSTSGAVGRALLAMRSRCIVLGAVLLPAPAVHAQDDAVLRVPLEPAEVTKAAVQARLGALKGAGVPTAVRKDGEAAYEEALGLVDGIAAARRRVAAADELQLRGPREIESLSTAKPAEIDREALAELDTDGVAARLKTARAAADLARRTVGERDKELADLAARSKVLPTSVADAEKRARELEAAWLATKDTKTDPLADAANRTVAAARLAAARAELDAGRAELGTLQLAQDLAAARRQRASRDAADAARLVKALQELLERRTRTDVERMLVETREQLDQLGSQNKELVAAATHSVTFAEKRRDLQARLLGLEGRVQKIRKEHRELQERFAAIRQMVAHVGLKQLTGDLLRHRKSRMPDVAGYRLEARKLRDEAVAIRVQQIKVGEILAVDEDQFVALAAKSEGAAPAADFEALARRVFRARLDVLTALQRDHDDKLAELARFETEGLLLSRLVAEFELYIDEKILWIRSTDPLWTADYAKLPAVLANLPEAVSVAEAVFDSLSAQIASVAGIGLLFVLLLLPRRKLRGALREIGARAAPPTCMSFRPTVLALLVSALIAAPPAVLLWGSWVVCGGDDVVDFAGSGLAAAMIPAALAALVLGFSHSICIAGGVAESHLGWNEETTARLRRCAMLGLAVGVPILFAGQVADAGLPIVRSLVGRPVFLAGWLFAAFLFGGLFWPGRSILDPSRESPELRPHVVRSAVPLLAIALPVVLVALAVAGYYFTAARLGSRLLWTFALVFGLVLADGLVNRWQLISRRILAVRQRRERAEAAARLAEDATGSGGAAAAQEERLSVAEVSAQARRLSRTAFVVVGVVALYAVWSDVLPALGGLREYEVWKTTELVAPDATAGSDATAPIRERAVPITLAHVLLGLIVLAMTAVAAKDIPGLLKLSLLQKVRPGNQYAIATLVQYGIVVLGVVLAFGAIGIGWSKVQWLVAAVSLGLGFGLQEIFANFVSGVILLFEQPIRVGDFVSVGAVKGEVTRIRIRATTIRNLERQELIVPNREFVTGQVINWTLTDRVVRIVINVGVAYGSDVQLVQSTLLRVAEENPYLTKEPKPKALFREFGDSALIFELRIYIRDLDHWPKAVDSMHHAIDREFRKAGIEIAFPQRDLHVRSVDARLPVDVGGSAAAGGACDPDPEETPRE